MASAAPQQNFPLLYNDVVPLSSREHAEYKLQVRPKMPFLADTHAVPVTIDEFVVVQRHMPIVLSSGDNPVPLALMGLNQGVNVFLNEKGELAGNAVYMPAYARRYPFLLAKLRQDSEELSSVSILRPISSADMRRVKPCSRAEKRLKRRKAFCSSASRSRRRDTGLCLLSKNS